MSHGSHRRVDGSPHNGTILFVANFPAGTGYAWATIERLFRQVGGRFADRGWRMAVCHPGPRAPDASAPPDSHEFDFARTRSPSGLLSFARFLRRHTVRVLYLTDQPTWGVRYLVFRLVGVRVIVVHERTSGTRAARNPLWLGIKRLLHQVPGMSTDLLIAVSDFVAARTVRASGIPKRRVVRVYNGIDLAPFAEASSSLRAELGLPEGSRLVFTASRAAPQKGLGTLLDAAAMLEAADEYPHLHFVYAGDGPILSELRQRASALRLTRFHFLGRRHDVPQLLASADIVVVPSEWAEAFGLSVVEGMAAGKPVIATRAGGIPELIEEGVTGLLIAPGDSAALLESIRLLLDRPDQAAEMGANGARVARDRFDLSRVVEEIASLVSNRLG